MTYEEISTKYPIGKLLYRTINKVRRAGFWHNDQDKKIYLAKYPDAEFTLNGGVVYTETVFNEKRVEGWLRTEEGWFVAEDDWDGWEPVDQEDLDRWEALGIVSQYQF